MGLTRLLISIALYRYGKGLFLLVYQRYALADILNIIPIRLIANLFNDIVN